MSTYNVWSSQAVTLNKGTTNGLYTNSATSAAITPVKGLVSLCAKLTVGATPPTSKGGRIRLCVASTPFEPASLADAHKLPLCADVSVDILSSHTGDVIYIPSIVFTLHGFNVYCWVQTEGFIDDDTSANLTLDGILSEINQ